MCSLFLHLSNSLNDMYSIKPVESYCSASFWRCKNVGGLLIRRKTKGYSVLKSLKQGKTGFALLHSKVQGHWCITNNKGPYISDHWIFRTFSGKLSLISVIILCLNHLDTATFPWRLVISDELLVFFNTFNIFFCVYFYLLNFNASYYFLNSVWLIWPFQDNVHAYKVGVKNEKSTHIFYKVNVSVLIWLQFGNYLDIFSVQICWYCCFCGITCVIFAKSSTKVEWKEHFHNLYHKKKSFLENVLHVLVCIIVKYNYIQFTDCH